MLQKKILPLLLGSAVCIGADLPAAGVNACHPVPSNITLPACSNTTTKASKLLALGTACVFIGSELYQLMTEGAASTMTAKALISAQGITWSTLVPDLSPLEGFAYQCSLVGSIYAGYLPVAHYGNQVIECIKKRCTSKKIIARAHLGKDETNQDVYIILYNKHQDGSFVQFVHVRADHTLEILASKIGLKEPVLISLDMNGKLSVDTFINQKHVERYYQFSEKMSVQDFNETCVHLKDFLELLKK